MPLAKILILYYSKQGGTSQLARQIARGVATVDGANPVIRYISPTNETQIDEASASHPPPPTLADLQNCDGLALGSPTRFGNMAAPVKEFIDNTAAEWFSGSLIGKPGAVFTSTASMHGGQESTLLSMMLPLLHHGMAIIGLPYSHVALHTTTTGGTPYGASHYSGADSHKISEDEKILAQALGRRLACAAMSLKTQRIDD